MWSESSKLSENTGLVVHYRQSPVISRGFRAKTITYCFSEDVVKLMSPLVMTTGGGVDDAAKLRADARMLARFGGSAMPPAAGLGVVTGAVLAVRATCGGGPGGLLTGVPPDCGVGGMRPTPRSAPNNAIGSGVADFCGSAL